MSCKHSTRVCEVSVTFGVASGFENKRVCVGVRKQGLIKAKVLVSLADACGHSRQVAEME